VCDWEVLSSANQSLQLAYRHAKKGAVLEDEQHQAGAHDTYLEIYEPPAPRRPGDQDSHVVINQNRGQKDENIGGNKRHVKDAACHQKHRPAPTPLKCVVKGGYNYEKADKLEGIE
jgi:hypothetical protein